MKYFAWFILMATPFICYLMLAISPWWIALPVILLWVYAFGQALEDRIEASNDYLDHEPIKEIAKWVSNPATTDSDTVILGLNTQIYVMKKNGWTELEADGSDLHMEMELKGPT